MARQRRPIVPHLSPGEIARRYRACRSGVEKTHGQLLWLLTRSEAPPTPVAVAAQVGLTPAWVPTILTRWNAAGPAGLADRRKATNGGRPKLSDEQRAALFEALRGRPADGGLWTGPKVAAYARDRWGVAVRPDTGWRWLKRERSGSAAGPPTAPAQAARCGMAIRLWYPGGGPARLGR
jgi:hypothetical protein